MHGRSILCTVEKGKNKRVAWSSGKQHVLAMNLSLAPSHSPESGRLTRLGMHAGGPVWRKCPFSCLPACVTHPSSVTPSVPCAEYNKKSGSFFFAIALSPTFVLFLLYSPSLDDVTLTFFLRSCKNIAVTRYLRIIFTAHHCTLS